MNLGIISDETRDDNMKARREAARAPECECVNSADLCDKCQNKLASYDKTAMDLRSLSHVVAGVLGSFGQQMPVEARGRLRAAFTEYALPHLPGWSSQFWQILANLVQDGIAEDEQSAQARRLAHDLDTRGYAIVEDEKERVV